MAGRSSRDVSGPLPGSVGSQAGGPQGAVSGQERVCRSPQGAVRCGHAHPKVSALS